LVLCIVMDSSEMLGGVAGGVKVSFHDPRKAYSSFPSAPARIREAVVG